MGPPRVRRHSSRSIATRRLSVAALSCCAAALLGGVWCAVAGTNDCDLADLVLIFAIVAGVFLLVAVAVRTHRARVALHGRFRTAALACGLALVLLIAAVINLHLTARGDCG